MKYRNLLDKRRKIGLLFLCMAAVAVVLTLNTGYVVYRICKGISILFILISIYLIFITKQAESIMLKYAKKIMLFITRKILNIVTHIAEKIKKAEKVLAAVTKKILYILTYIIEKIKEKFGFKLTGSFKKIHMAKEYVDTKERVALNGKKAARKKKKKYKDMDNIERIRFFYERRIASAMKKGVEIEESMTPNEAGDKLIRHRQMKNESMELIDKYNIARYDDEGVITDEMVERVKKL